MNLLDLTRQLLMPEDQEVLASSLALLEEGKYAAFYERNQAAVQTILFIESLEEFLDFSQQEKLDPECFCAAFLCGRGGGAQIGGYMEDLTRDLTDFFSQQNAAYPEVLEIIGRETICTDGGDCDNFKPAMTAVNQALESHGRRLLVLEDCMYCGCQYTLLLLDQTLCKTAAASWDSESFEIYL